MTHVKRFMASCIAIMMVLAMSVPIGVFADSDADFDASHQELRTILDRLEDLQSTIDTLDDDEEDFEDFRNDILDALMDAKIELQDMDEQISSSNHSDLDGTVEDIIDVSVEISADLRAQMSSSFDNDIDNLEDEISDITDDIEQRLEEFEDMDDEDTNTDSDADDSNATTRITLNINTRINELSELDVEAIGSGEVRFDTFVMDMMDIFDDLENDLENLASLTAGEKIELRNAMDRYEDAVDDVLDDVETSIHSSLDDNFTDLEVDVAARLEALDDILVSLGVTTGTTAPSGGVCFDTTTISNRLSTLHRSAMDLLRDAEDADTDVQFEAFMEAALDVASELHVTVAGLDGKSVATADVNAMNTLHADIAEELNAAIDALDEDSDAFNAGDFNDFQDNFDEIMSDTDASFSNFALNNASCTASPLETGALPTQRFPDVSLMNEFWVYIESLALANILHGYPDGMFKSKNQITRAEYIKIALNAAAIDVSAQGQGTVYADVPTSHSLLPYINYSASTGLLPPMSNNRFEPDTPITRADAVMVTLKAFNRSNLEMRDNPFMDVTDPTQAMYIAAAADWEIISGYAVGRFGPNLRITRDEAAKVISKAIEAFLAF